jgi:NAD(P)-dependent dehydrogenase (short-subunit alcohol dehydrogenase family)
MSGTNKHAAAYGAGGAVGGAVARAFARNGAKAFLTGRTIASVKAVADDIARTGGTVEVAQVEALDEGAVEAHLDSVVQKAGKINVSANTITPVTQPGIQSIPLAHLPVDSFMAPISSYLRSHFLTARAAAGRMAQGRAGVVLMDTPEPARLGLPLVGDIGPAWAMETLSRNLSAEFTSHGVRAVCSHSTGLPEAHTIDVVFGLSCKNDRDHGRSVPAMVENLTHKKRSTSVADVLECAALPASHKASGLTGTVANVTDRVAGRLA